MRIDFNIFTVSQASLWLQTVSLVWMCLMQVIQDAVYDAYYKLTDSHSQIKAYVFDVVRGTVPKILLDDVFLVSIVIVADVFACWNGLARLSLFCAD
jgi:hypothetical protein